MVFDKPAKCAKQRSYYESRNTGFCVFVFSSSYEKFITGFSPTGLWTDLKAMSEQEENTTPGDGTQTTESENDQENTPEDVSVHIVFMRVKAADITAHLRCKYWWNSPYNMFIHHLLLNVSEVYHLFFRSHSLFNVM